MSVKVSTQSKDPVGGSGSVFDLGKERICKARGHSYHREVLAQDGNWYEHVSKTCFRCGKSKK